MSTHNRHRTKTLFVYPWWQSAVIVILLLGDTYAVTTSLTCPESYFNGQNVSVVCVVDTSDVANICSFPTAVNYQFKSVTGLSDDRCSTSYLSCSPPAGADRCGCVNQPSTANTYVYNFVANETLHKGGNITCMIDCSYSGTATTQNFGNCISISFGETSTSTQSSTKEQTYSSTSPSSNVTDQTSSPTSSSASATSNVKGEKSSRDGCDTDCKTGLGVGLGVGIPVVITSTVVIVYVVKKRNLCCSNTPNTTTTTPTTQNTTTTPHTTTNTQNGRG